MRVTLTGDRSGDYVVVEERPDGSLVLEVDRDAGAHRKPARDQPRGGGGLLALLTRRSQPTSLPEVLDSLGVQLASDEHVAQFLFAEIEGAAGYVLLTNVRFLFVPDTAARSARPPGSTSGRIERSLDTLREAELVGRGRRQRLLVTWESSQTLITAFDRAVLAQLERRLRAGRPPG